MRLVWALSLFLMLLSSQAYSAGLLDDAKTAIKERQFVEAESLLQRTLEADPKQDEARFWLAKVLAWQGHYAESSNEYQKLLEKEPGNTDYMLGQAQVLVWSRKPKEALPILVHAESLNPADADLVRLHIQALAAIGDATSNDEALKLQSDAKVLFPAQTWNIVSADLDASTRTAEQSALRTKDALDRDFAEEHNDQIGAGFAYDHLSKGKGNWRAGFLEYEHRFAPRKIVYGSVQESERFGLNDLQIMVGGYHPLPSDMTLNVEVNASTTHRMVPKNSEMASVQVPLPAKGWFVTGGLRRSEYTTSRTYSEFGMLESYFGDYRAAYTLTGTEAHGNTLFGHRFSLSRYYNDISFVTLTVSKGREVDSELGRTHFYNTTFIGMNGRHWFNRDWALLWSLGRTEQDTAYTRTGLSLGIRRAF